jgi:hypothetical protein
MSNTFLKAEITMGKGGGSKYYFGSEFGSGLFVMFVLQIRLSSIDA